MNNKRETNKAFEARLEGEGEKTWKAEKGKERKQYIGEIARDKELEE